MTEMQTALRVSRQQKHFPVPSADNEQLRQFYKVTMGVARRVRDGQTIEQAGVPGRSGERHAAANGPGGVSSRSPVNPVDGELDENSDE